MTSAEGPQSGDRGSGAPSAAGDTRARTEGAGAPMSEEQFERRFSALFARHWAQVRQESGEGASRRFPADLEPDDEEAAAVHAGPSNFARAQVPYGVDLAAAWSWRFLVIVAAGYLIYRALGFFALVVMPIVIALLLAALISPLVNLLAKVVRRGFAAFAVVVSVLSVIGLMLTFVTQQIVDGAGDLADQVVSGLDQIREWLQTGPLHATEAQIDNAITELQALVLTSNEQLVGRAQEFGTAVGNIVTGFFIVLFASFFFLADGRRIWLWVVRLFPRAARTRADASGKVAWLSLTQFVRATVMVAFVDALGIMLVAAILDVPFILAIGLLVFLGGFVPLVGATISGLVATLVALVAQGPLVAVLMLAGVIVVQQVEANVLQPFLLGRMVSVHPLGVILAITAGWFLAGIAGALVAVPLAASVNAVVTYLNAAPPDSEHSDEDIEDVVNEGPAAADPGPATA